MVTCDINVVLIWKQNPIVRELLPSIVWKNLVNIGFQFKYIHSMTTYLIEFEHVKKLEKLAVLLVVLQLHVILLKAVKGKFGFIIDVYLHGVLHELQTYGTDFFGERCREHHHLLLRRSIPVDLLNVASHVCQ